MRTLATLTALALVLLSARGAAQGRRITSFPYMQPFAWVTGTTSSFPSSGIDGGEFTLDAGTGGWTTSIQSHGLNNNGGAGGAIRIQPTASTNNGIAGFVWHGDFTGRCGDSLILDWSKVQAGATGGTRTNELRVGTNNGSGSAFTDIPIANVAGGAWPRFDNTSTPQSGTLRLKLPSSLGGSSDVRIRIYSVNTGGAGSLPRVVIDNLGIATIDPPSIIAGPHDERICEGSTAHFAVEAGGIGLTYQWRHDGLPIPGAVASLLTIARVTAVDAGSYDVLVSGTCTLPARSNAARLVVDTAPAIVEEPRGETVCHGEPVTFRVTATGTDLTFQWRRNGVPIEGATTAAYTVEHARETDAGTYDVVIRGLCHPTATSRAAELTINREPIVAEQPRDQTVILGAPVTFRVQAYGTAPLRYQWQKNGVDIPGATGSSFTIRAITHNDVAGYNCVIGNICTPPMTVTNSAWLFVKEMAGIIAPPGGTTMCEGEEMMIRVSAPDDGSRYRWMKDGIEIPDAKGPELTIAHVTRGDEGRYHCAITQAEGPEVPTAPIEITVKARPMLAVQPEDRKVCAGESAAFSVDAVGEELRYQWRRNGVEIAGATEAVHTITSADVADTGSYDCRISGACGASISSRAARLTMAPATQITEQPKDRNVHVGDTIELRVEATGEELAYQWRKDGVEIPGATSSRYVVRHATRGANGLYDVLVRGCSGSRTSISVRVDVGGSTLTTAEMNGIDGDAMLLVTPNPADGAVRIEIRLPRDAEVGDKARLLFYDILGNRVADLSVGLCAGNRGRAYLDAGALPSGRYHCRLEMPAWSGPLGVITIVR